MQNHFQQELNELKETLLRMGGQAEVSVNKAVKALVSRDDALAEEAIQMDEDIDRLEMEIDERAIRLLSKAPLASDLRLITVAMKGGHDLERVGDEATTIARRTLELNAEPELKPATDIPSMAEKALDMLNAALDSFVHHDVEKARAVIPADKEVDVLNKQLHRELADDMIGNPAHISRCLNLMTVSKSIERIADHATNIAEEVVYLYEGRDIRHTAAAPASA
jgi:phosphate transport system protein